MQLRYLWVKEIADASKPHFHVVLFVNKDIFVGLGIFCIQEITWARSFRMPG